MLRDHEIPIRKRTDYPPPVPKGTHQTAEHRRKISLALKGNENWKDSTGKHVNWKREEVPCAYCGAITTKKACHINKGNVFCDKDCLGKANGKRLTGENNPRYSRVTVSCAWCGKDLLRQKTDAAQIKNFFCDTKHNGLWKSENLVGEKVYNFKGGYEPYYGKNWRSQRRQAWERDNYTCQRCFITKEEKGKNPDVHHIRPFRTFGLKNYKKANLLTNLICLCNRCHKIVEEEINDKQ
ncbi:hypothetical protein BH10ACI2_BH10ACI2_04440 [soil metagenome]